MYSPRNGLRAAQLGAAAGMLAARLTPTPGVVGSTTKARPAQRHNHRATARKKVMVGPISFPDQRSNRGDASAQPTARPYFARKIGGYANARNDGYPNQHTRQNLR